MEHDDRDVARRLARMRRAAEREARRRARRAAKAARPAAPTSLRIIRIAAIVVAALLPIVALVRITLWLDRMGWPAWPALAGGVLATASLLVLYASLLAKRWTGRFRLSGFVVKMLAGIVAGYTAFTLVTISATNLKSERLRAYYREIHPALRVAVATAALADEQLVLTDIARTPADYARLGLPVNESSRHFAQADGYVHAVDLRTQGRPEWLNTATDLYFAVMGFGTLRHVGTADHLHVSLPAR